MSPCSYQTWDFKISLNDPVVTKHTLTVCCLFCFVWAFFKQRYFAQFFELAQFYFELFIHVYGENLLTNTHSLMLFHKSSKCWVFRL